MILSYSVFYWACYYGLNSEHKMESVWKNIQLLKNILQQKNNFLNITLYPLAFETVNYSIYLVSESEK